MNQTIVPQWQKWMMEALMPLIRYYVSKRVDTSDETVNQAKVNIKKHLDDVCNAECVRGLLGKSPPLCHQLDSLLSDGREFLRGTSEPTYIDLVFATMLGLLTLHENRGGRAIEQDSKVLASGDESEKVTGFLLSAALYSKKRFPTWTTR